VKRTTWAQFRERGNEAQELIRTKSKILLTTDIDPSILDNSYLGRRSVMFEKDSMVYIILSGNMGTGWLEATVPYTISVSPSSMLTHRYDFEYQHSVVDNGKVVSVWMLDPYSLTRLNLIDDVERVYNTFTGIPAALLECSDTEWNRMYARQFKDYYELSE